MATADRVLSIFGLFSLERPQWTVEAAAAELGLSVSTTYRYFRSLSDAGLIAPHTTGRYVLGPAILQYDRLTRHFDPLINTARPVMIGLARSCGASTVAMLCRQFQDQVMCVHQEVGGQPDFAMSFERGQLMPAFKGAVCMAIWANLPSRVVRQAFRRTWPDASEEQWSTMRARLRQLRGQVCVTHSEIDQGLIGIAAPVFAAPGDVAGSIGVVISQTQAPPTLDHLAEAVRQAAETTSATLDRDRGEDATERLTSRRPATKSAENSRIVGN